MTNVDSLIYEPIDEQQSKTTSLKGWRPDSKARKIAERHIGNFFKELCKDYSEEDAIRILAIYCWDIVLDCKRQYRIDPTS